MPGSQAGPGSPARAGSSGSFLRLSASVIFARLLQAVLDGVLHRVAAALEVHGHVAARGVEVVKPQVDHLAVGAHGVEAGDGVLLACRRPASCGWC